MSLGSRRTTYTWPVAEPRDIGDQHQQPDKAVPERCSGITSACIDSANIPWQPLLRDGGGRLNRRYALYDLTSGWDGDGFNDNLQMISQQTVKSGIMVRRRRTFQRAVYIAQGRLPIIGAGGLSRMRHGARHVAHRG